MPFAAFFVAFLLLLCIPDGSRKLAVCLLLGALAGLCAVHTTSIEWTDFQNQQTERWLEFSTHAPVVQMHRYAGGGGFGDDKGTVDFWRG